MKKLWVFFSLWLALSAQAALNVLACEPEWAALVRELGGERVTATSATTALQDVHRIEARPSLIAQARRADLLVCTGADLETGWLPLLQRESGNAAIQPGKPGFFETARHARLIERPASVDRSLGDLHAAGNPHLHLDPRNLLAVAGALGERLAAIDPANAAYYGERQRDFAARLQAAIARWEQRAAPLRGMPVIVQHKSWSYLANWLGLRVVADLEPKPGIEPSAAYLAQLLAGLKTQPAKLVLRAAYQSPRAADWLAQRAGIGVVELPYTVGGSNEARDLFALFDDTLARLLEAAK